MERKSAGEPTAALEDSIVGLPDSTRREMLFELKHSSWRVILVWAFQVVVLGLVRTVWPQIFISGPGWIVWLAYLGLLLMWSIFPTYRVYRIVVKSIRTQEPSSVLDAFKQAAWCALVIALTTSAFFWVLAVVAKSSG